MVVVHIACINLSSDSGMGRIAVNWKKAFEAAGHQFIHIGMKEVKAGHVILWGRHALAYCKKNAIYADVWLVHEPFGGFFRSMSGKLVVFSHGIEERAWLIQEQYKFHQRTIKSFFLPKQIRFFSNNKGLKAADLVLLSNSSDKIYLEQKGFKHSKKMIFRNGYSSFQRTNQLKSLYPSILINGTWISRKGIDVIYKAFNKLLKTYPQLQLILAGTEFDEKFVLAGFQPELRLSVSVIPRFTEDQEASLYSQSSIFILPSYFEGQSLALTQAMAMGLCPVVSDNSGQIDFVKHRDNGLLFETGSAESLYNQLVFLINNEYLIQQYGSEARRSVEHLAWEKVASDVVSAVESIL